MTPFHLNNKTILITGASSGIGKQAAISFNEMGADVIITGRDKKRLEETFQLLNGKNNLQFITDLLVQDELQNFVKQLPQLDGVFNCAGIVKPFPIKFISAEVLDEVFKINFNAQVLLMTQLTRQKKINKNASIVFSSSIAAAHPYKGGALYSSSKAALETYSKRARIFKSWHSVKLYCFSYGKNSNV